LEKRDIQLNMGTDKRLCITVPESAELPGVSKNYCCELARRGMIPAIRFGRSRLTRGVGLVKMLEKCLIG
jgi:excisionase family DNA binding protein